MNDAYYSYFLQHHLRPAVRCRPKRPNLLNSHAIVLNDCVRSHKAAPVVSIGLLRIWNWKLWGILHTPQICVHVSLTFSRKLPLRGVRFRIRQVITAAVEQSVRRLV